MKRSRIWSFAFVFGLLVFIGMSWYSIGDKTEGELSVASSDSEKADQSLSLETAIFAGGCFWCMEGPFERLDGVKSVISGYTGGKKPNPTYREVASGKTNHAEAVEVRYDPKKVNYEKLLHVFWRSINPTQANGQFADKGKQYRTGIFYLNESQKELAEISKKNLAESKKFNKPIVTEIVSASPFYPAEEYHQDYYKKNSAHYKAYRRGSGREGFLRKTWGRKSTRDLVKAKPTSRSRISNSNYEARNSKQIRMIKILNVTHHWLWKKVKTFEFWI